MYYFTVVFYIVSRSIYNNTSTIYIHFLYVLRKNRGNSDDNLKKINQFQIEDFRRRGHTYANILIARLLLWLVIKRIAVHQKGCDSYTLNPPLSLFVSIADLRMRY